MSTQTVVRVTADASGYTTELDRAKRSAESFAASQEAVSKRMRAAQDATKEAPTSGSKASSASAINRSFSRTRAWLIR